MIKFIIFIYTQLYIFTQYRTNIFISAYLVSEISTISKVLQKESEDVHEQS